MMYKKTLVGLLAGSMLVGSASVAFAEAPVPMLISANPQVVAEQDKIQALLKQIEALQLQLRALRGEVEAVKTELRLRTTLSLGSQGDDVRLLQEVLSTDSTIYPEGKITGYYGPMTAAAVKRFQMRHGFEGVGSVGPKTQAKLNELISSGAGKSGKIPPGLLSKGDVRLFAALQAVDGSMVHGKAVLKDEDGKLKVEIETYLSSTTDTGVRPAHIHVGTCSTTGAVKYPLTDVVNGRSVTLLSATVADIIAGLPLHVMVHKSASELSTIVSCGDIVKPAGMQAQVKTQDGWQTQNQAGELDRNRGGKAWDDSASTSAPKMEMEHGVLVPVMTLAQVALHATPADCWVAIAGKVYNVTSFIPNHPGGEGIKNTCGTDATTLFPTKHGGMNKPGNLDALIVGKL